MDTNNNNKQRKKPQIVPRCTVDTLFATSLVDIAIMYVSSNKALAAGAGRGGGRGVGGIEGGDRGNHVLWRPFFETCYFSYDKNLCRSFHKRSVSFYSPCIIA